MEYMTAGDAHGQALVALVSGVPAGLRLSSEQAESDLHRCLSGYQAPTGAFRYVEVESGLWENTTTGAPVAFLIYGDDEPDQAREAAQSGEEVQVGEALQVQCAASWEAAGSWEAAHAGGAGGAGGLTPRPNRGDLAAMLKTASDSVSPVAQRLDSYDTAACVVAASVPREFLAQFGVEVSSLVTRIGSASLSRESVQAIMANYSALDTEFSAVRCPDQGVSEEMLACLEQARAQGKTLGGTFQLLVSGLLPGLGSFAQRRERLNARLAAALFSLPGVVAVEFGDGCALAQGEGPACHDAILVGASLGFTRASNHAGGIEEGLCSGEPLLISVSVASPSPTGAGAESINVETLEPACCSAKAAPVCVVPGIAVAAEAEVAFVLANAYLEQFGNANMTDISASVSAYSNRLKRAAR